jgi:hypothetical protein
MNQPRVCTLCGRKGSLWHFRAALWCGSPDAPHHDLCSQCQETERDRSLGSWRSISMASGDGGRALPRELLMTHGASLPRTGLWMRGLPPRSLGARAGSPTSRAASIARSTR